MDAPNLSNAPAIIRNMSAKFLRTLGIEAAQQARHDPTDHERVLFSVAQATELGIFIIQRYPPTMLEQHFAQMEHELIRPHPSGPIGCVCSTCGARVAADDLIRHAQVHAGAAFMASIFPAYDPEKPHM